MRMFRMRPTRGSARGCACGARQRGSLYHRILNRLPRLTIHLVLIGIGIGMVFPFLWMLTTSFKTPQEVLAFPPTFSSDRVLNFRPVAAFLKMKRLFGSGDFLAMLAETRHLAIELVVLIALIAFWWVRRKDKWKGPDELAATRKQRYFSGLGLTFVLLLWVWNIGVEAWGELFYNYIFAWKSQSFARYFFNSCFIALVTTTLQLLTSALAAFAFSFLKFPGSNAIFLVFLGTMMIPHQALLVPDYLILANLGWINTYLSLIVPFIASVFGIFLLRQFFMTMPRDLYDAATIDGCSDLGFFFRIILPLSIAPLTTLGIFTFIGSWNSFLWALIVTHTDKLRTVQVGLAAFSSSEGTRYELLMAASTFCILPLIIGFFLAQKQFIEGISRSGMKE